MKHEIPVAELGPLGLPMAEAVQTCVHCGFCLPTCPTYQVLGQEQDSPRGRIFLMKEVLEGRVAAEQATSAIDQCLGCVACETACPSGVKYGELISPYRAITEPARQRPLFERLRRWLVGATLPYPNRFRWALRLAQWTGWTKPLVPGPLRPMLDLVPRHLPPAEPLQERYPALGKPRAKVALLAGCAQQVLAPEINRATIDVLTRNGVEVLVPRRQQCCGALAWHTGEHAAAARFARANLAAFPVAEVDAVVTNAAGCGSGLHDYPMILRGTEQEPAAQAFAKKVTDVSVFLNKLGLVGTPAFARPVRIAYHDACHLGHAQKVRSAPRRLLQAIGNVTLVEVGDDTCCGSAGTYNIDQPAIAAALGQKKAALLAATHCDAVALGNIGCQVQIDRYLQATARPVPVRHTLQILAHAYAGKEI